MDLACEILEQIQDIRSRIAIDPDPGDTGNPASGMQQNAFETSSIADSVEPIHCTLPMDDAEFREIVIDFIERLDERPESLKQACVDCEFARVADEAHWLKGAGGTVGFAELTEPAKGLETAARSESAAAVESALHEIITVRARMIVPNSESDMTA